MEAKHLIEIRKFIRKVINENIFTDIGHTFKNLAHIPSDAEKTKNKLEDLRDQAFNEYQYIGRVYVDSGDYNNMTGEFGPWIRWEDKSGEYLVAYESKESKQEAINEYKRDLEKFTEEYIEKSGIKYPTIALSPTPSIA